MACQFDLVQQTEEGIVSNNGCLGRFETFYVHHWNQHVKKVENLLCSISVAYERE